MIDDKRLRDLVRLAIPPVAAVKPSRDLWPSVVEKIQAPAEWSWVDVALAAAVLIALAVFPEWLFVIVYHL